MDFSQFDLTDPFVRRALAETLAEDNGLDYQDEYIRKALNDEIAAAAAPKPIDGERNFLGDTVSRLARGGVQLADTAIHAVDTAVGGSETLQGWSDSLDKAKQNVGLLRPDKSEHEEGWLKRSYGQALESAPMSAVPWAGAMAGAKAGAALGTMALPGAGTAAGMVAGGLIGAVVLRQVTGIIGRLEHHIERCPGIVAIMLDFSDEGPSREHSGNGLIDSNRNGYNRRSVLAADFTGHDFGADSDHHRSKPEFREFPLQPVKARGQCLKAIRGNRTGYLHGALLSCHPSI